MAQPAIWLINPLQTLSQGLVLTLSFTFDPELDKNQCLPGVHETEGDAADEAGSEGNGGGHEQVPQIRGGVQVRDCQTLIGSGVEAGKGGVQPPELPDPGGAVHTRRVATALETGNQSWSYSSSF